MKQEFWIKALRWIGFLPAALIAASVVRFLNYLGAAQMGIYPQEGGLFASLFMVYDDAIEAAVVVVVGALVAPAGRPIVAAILATLQSGMWFFLMFIEIAINRVLVTSQRPGALWVLIGSIIGAVYVYREHNNSNGMDTNTYSG